MGGVRPVKFIDFSTAAFFDRSSVVNSMDRVTRRALSLAAMDVRRAAKRSMKARPVGQHAPKGMPPYKHKHSPRGKRSGRDYGLERSIMYAYDAATQSAVVGPSSIRGAGIHAIAERHEFGGASRRKNPRRTVRRLGRPGEIAVDAGRKTVPRLKMATARVQDTCLGPVDVTYAPLTTQAQLRRANRLNAALYGPAILHGTYPTRPFMRPSLELIAPRMADYFGKATR